MYLRLEYNGETIYGEQVNLEEDINLFLNAVYTCLFSYITFEIDKNELSCFYDKDEWWDK